VLAWNHSYPDEAMLRDRHSDLLAWLVDPKKGVIFDESHLGIASNPGLSLARKYKLHGLLRVFYNSVALCVDEQY
jgi:hypothetical protein